LGQAILVASISVGDVGLGFLELGLAEFDDGAQTQVVTGLRQIEGEAGLLAQLLKIKRAQCRRLRSRPNEGRVNSP